MESNHAPFSGGKPLPRYLFYLRQVNVTRWLMQLRWQQRFHHKFGTPAGHDQGWTAKIPQLPSHRHSFISHAVAIISLKDPLGFCRNVHLLGADAHCTASKKQIDGLMDGYKFVTCWNLGWVDKLDFLARKVCCDFVINAGFCFPELWHEESVSTRK